MGRETTKIREQLSQERIKRLNALGFVWDVLEFDWIEGFGHLQAYVNQEGNARPPKNYKTEDGYNLGAWVGTQRTIREQLSQERIKRLNALGFVWDVLEFDWEKGFGHLQAYVNQEGNARPPSEL